MTQSIAALRGETDLTGSRREPFYMAKYVFISLFIFVLCLIEAKYPDHVSRPVARWVNTISGKNTVFDHVSLDFALYDTFSGVILCAVLLSISLDFYSRIFSNVYWSTLPLRFGRRSCSRLSYSLDISVQDVHPCRRMDLQLGISCATRFPRRLFHASLPSGYGIPRHQKYDWWVQSIRNAGVVNRSASKAVTASALQANLTH